MKRIIPTVTIPLLAAILLVGMAYAQRGDGLFQPFAISVTHQEPISIVSTHTLGSGQIVTVTSPMTVGVDLMITIDGPGLATVENSGVTTSSTEILIASPAPAPAGIEGFVDGSGRVYTTDVPDGIVLGQIQSKKSSLGTEIIGIVTNETDDELEYFEITVQLYDEAGMLLSVGSGYAALDTVKPGQTSPFTILEIVEYSNVSGYVIQMD